MGTRKRTRTWLEQAIVLSAALACSGCTMLDNALAAIPVFAFLRSAPSFDPYEAPRPAPAGSVPFESPTGDLLPPQLATEAAIPRTAGHVRPAAGPKVAVTLTSERGAISAMLHGRLSHGLEIESSAKF